jgi:ABC-2 type transport system ATP-binding protein
VQISRDVRKYIKSWVKENPDKTILLTTHYMAEADELCDRLAIIDQGKVLACDSPSNLKKSLQKEALFHIEVDLMLNDLDKFNQIPGVKNFAFEHKSHLGRTLLKFILEDDSVISDVSQALNENGSKIISFSKMEPSLEDVFISLVGKGLENENRS